MKSYLVSHRKDGKLVNTSIVFATSSLNAPTWSPIGKPVRAKGLTIDQMRDNFHSSQEGRELYNHGDTILVWMNEGDFHMLNFYKSQHLKDGE